MMTAQSKIDVIMEEMYKYSTTLEDDGGTYEGYNVVNTYHIKEILTKHLTDTPSECKHDFKRQGGLGDRGYFIPGDEIFFRAGDGYQYRSINDLCSIDSGLRQFVCEKGLVDEVNGEKYCTHISIGYIGIGDEFEGEINSYKDIDYRLMLSSIQESKEKFLLDNILLGKTQHE